MVAATFGLVIAGGLVTSTGSALAVPDWPLSFGQVFPPMVGGVLYEHGHRLAAAAIGILTIVLAIWIWLQAQEPLLKKAGWIALGLVCCQGVLGGVTVLLKLPAMTSVGHACLGQVVFSWICCIAVMVHDVIPAKAGTQSPDALGPVPFLRGYRTGLSPGSKGDDFRRGDGVKLRRLALITTGFVFLQLIFGAIYRHVGLLLHFHFLGAALVFVYGILLYSRVKKSASGDGWLLRPATLLLALIFVQIGLGLYTWQNPTVFDATAHVAVGALILAMSVVISLESFRRMTA